MRRGNGERGIVLSVKTLAKLNQRYILEWLWGEFAQQKRVRATTEAQSTPDKTVWIPAGGRKLEDG